MKNKTTFSRLSDGGGTGVFFTRPCDSQKIFEPCSTRSASKENDTNELVYTVCVNEIRNIFQFAFFSQLDTFSIVEMSP